MRVRALADPAPRAVGCGSDRGRERDRRGLAGAAADLVVSKLILQYTPTKSDFEGDYIVFVATPDEAGVDGIVCYSLGPFPDAQSAHLAARVAHRDAPDSFVRFCPIRRAAPCEAPLVAVLRSTPATP